MSLIKSIVSCKFSWKASLITFLIFSFLLIGCQKSKLSIIDITSIKKVEWDKKTPCKVEFEGHHFNAKIKFRGGMSSRYEKHSFALELDKKTSLAGFPKEDDYILNANYIDKTFMRHKVCFDLFQQMSSKNIAAKCSYVNVHLDDEPQGIYVLMEEINAKKLGLNKSDSLAMIFKDPPIFYENRLDSNQTIKNYYQQKFPKLAKSDKTVYLEKFKAFLFNSSNEEFAREISDWVDIENIIDWHLMLLLTNNGDGIMKNFYLYKLNAKTPFRIAIWDYDHSFCRDGDNEYNSMQTELKWRNSVLLDRLISINSTGYTEALAERWLTLRSTNIFSYQNIEDMMESNLELIKNNLKENFNIWPVDSHWYFDKNDFEQEYALILDCVERRLIQMDEYIPSL